MTTKIPEIKYIVKNNKGLSIQDIKRADFIDNFAFRISTDK
jgi:hypothetical protein